jgi:hypothetical protein
LSSRPDFSDDDSSFFLRLEKEKNKKYITRTKYQLTQHLRVRHDFSDDDNARSFVAWKNERKNMKEKEKEKV